MPAESESQRQAAAMALQAKKGQMSKQQLKGAAREMFESMSAKELRDYASTKAASKPDKKTKAPATGIKKKPGRPPKKKKGNTNAG